MPDRKENKPTKDVQQSEDEFEEEEKGKDQVQEIQEKVPDSTALIAPKDYFNYFKDHERKKVKRLATKKTPKMSESEVPTILVAPADYKNYMHKTGAWVKMKTVENESQLPTVLIGAPPDYINYTQGFPRPKAKKENFIPDDAPTVLVNHLQNRRSPKKQSPKMAAYRSPLRSPKKQVTRRQSTSEDVPFSEEEQAIIAARRNKRKKKRCCCCS